MANVTNVLPGLATLGSIGGVSPAAPPSASTFLDTLNSSLKNVSGLQAQASAAEESFAAGAPGATLGKALVSSDRAEVAWSATVAVRNEVVSAYQSIMNMQF